MDYTIILFVFETLLFLLAVIAVNVIIHELGHAIPALIITKNSTKILIGSFDDDTKSFKINLGLLKIWFKRNPLLWGRGACIYNASGVSLNKQILITAGGPFASLLAASAAIIVFLASGEHQQLKAITVPFLFFAVSFFTLSAFPIDKSFLSKKGAILFNDGYKIRAMARLKKYSTMQLRAHECYNRGDYKTASQIFEVLLTKKITFKTIFLNAFNAYMAHGDYEGVLRICANFSHKFNLTASEHCNIGIFKTIRGMYEEAKSDFETALALEPQNILCLCNLGYYYLTTGNFNKALTLFDEAITLDALFAYAYSNRGLVKIKLGQTQGGLNDIHNAIDIDANDAYAYRSLGIYYFDNSDYAKAILNFKKAFELDKTTHLIVELIAKAESHQTALKSI